MSRDHTLSTGGDLAVLRTAGACRRSFCAQLWRDAGGPLDAPERIPAGSHISGVCGPAARTVRRDERMAPLAGKAG